MTSPIKIPKKLIEVALPLDDINTAAAREKSIRHGHPSTLHLWWARRPLAAARAIIFAQMVNDPGGERGWTNQKTKAQAAKERKELFDIIRQLVKWENTTNEQVLARAREAIQKSWQETCELNKGKPGFDPDKLPAFHDPFAGGGAIPLEAQRLGLESYASDLNPVAVMINKAMIEIPPKFAGQSPVGPLPEGERQQDQIDAWQGACGLAEDVRRYGHWMREEAFKRIGHLYPKIKITPEMTVEREDLKPYVNKELTVIAWLWARTVKSPNPAFSHVDVPLVRSFILSSRQGNIAWVEPVINNDAYHFRVRMGTQPEDSIKGTVERKGGTCILSQTHMPLKYIREQGKAGLMGEKLMAIVAEGHQGRVYLSPEFYLCDVDNTAKSTWKPETPLPVNPRDFKTPNYGMITFGDLFTPRQLVALNTFSDLIQEARNKAINDAKTNGLADDDIGIEAGGTGARAYGDAIAVYLVFAINKMADRGSTICSWDSSRSSTRNTFGRQAIPMTWDYAESNPFSYSTGNYLNGITWVQNVISNMGNKCLSFATQQDAKTQETSYNKVISTDPPYYDNIGYADLSDFFYVWMRRSLKTIYPELFSTMATPKTEELVAAPYRHGGREAAERFFMDGMIKAIQNISEKSHPAFPVSIYYAFKQSETNQMGWETFLEAVIQAGFSIDGTWPMRTEMGNRMIGAGANALASSVVLVCKKREKDAAIISRRQFQRELREKMPESLEIMIGGTQDVSPIAPVDLAQAAIGPGMGIFSKYQSILNQDGSQMTVHDALILINRAITDYLNPESGNFDADTLFCNNWFSQYGWDEGPFGEANVLAQAKGTTVDGVANAGVIQSGAGKVRLLKCKEYPSHWDPKEDKRIPIWEACHHMIRVLNQHGETKAGELLAQMPEKGEYIRQLAYHLYTLCDRKKRAEDARAYNELIGAWHPILTASNDLEYPGIQLSLNGFGN
jgi:putative DNA methylase